MKKKNKLYIILGVIVLVACVWAFVSAGIITSSFRAKLAANKLGMQEVNIKNLLVTETKEGKKHWEMFADNGYYDSSSNKATLNGIVGNFYSDDKVVASFRSSKGTYDKETKKIMLYEDSVIVYKDGSNVSADRIVWEGKDSDIVAKHNVRMELPSKVVVYSDRATLSSDFTKLKVLGKSKTEIYDEDIEL